jgi:hypothetical protein
MMVMLVLWQSHHLFIALVIITLSILLIAALIILLIATLITVIMALVALMGYGLCIKYIVSIYIVAILLTFKARIIDLNMNQ